MQYSNTPSLQHSSVSILPLQKLQSHSLGPFEKTDSSPVRQHALFEDLDAGGFDLVDFAVEVVGVDGYVFKTVELLELLLFQKISDVKLHAVEVQAKCCLSARRGPFGNDFRACVFQVEIDGLPWVRCFQVQVIDPEIHRHLRNDIKF